MSARIQEGKGKVIVAKARRKGGERTTSTHGREFYEKIGCKGDKKRLRVKVQNSPGKFAVQVDKVAETGNKEESGRKRRSQTGGLNKRENATL